MPAPDPHIPPDTVAYAIGDVHGCLGPLRELEEFIREDAARSAATRRVVVYLGDYVDRGPDSLGVVEHLIGRPLAGFESVHLMGNHERMMLDFLLQPEAGQVWLANGGTQTLVSWGVELDLGAARDAGTMSLAAEQLNRRVTPAQRRFLEGLRLSHREGGALFVHAGIRPGVPLEAQEEEDLLWIRGAFLNAGDDHGVVVIHGHTPTEKPVLRANRIGIDTGACYGGALTAVGMDSTGVRVLRARA